ncbi:hypothetical protein N2152v2_006857 [Parachlorella kessleri]
MSPSRRLLQAVSPAVEAAQAANPIYTTNTARATPAGYGTAVGQAGPGGVPAAFLAPSEERSYTAGSPYSSADAGSASASDVLAAMLSGNATTFANAAAAAGPISAGVAAGNAIISGAGQVVISLVQAVQNMTNGPAAMDAFQTGMWRAICANPQAGGDTLATAIGAGDGVAHTAASAVNQAADQCCDQTMTAIARASSHPNFNQSFAAAAAGAGVVLPQCALPPALAHATQTSDLTATGTRAPGEAPGAGPAAQSVAAAGVPGATPVPEAAAGGAAPIPEPKPKPAQGSAGAAAPHDSG